MTLAELRAEIERLKAEAFASATVSTVEMLDWFLAWLAELDGVPRSQRPDRLRKVEEQAKLMGCSTRYLYDHRDDFPFLVVLPGDAIRFSERGYEKWLRSWKAA